MSSGGSGAVLALICLSLVAATPLDDYVNLDDGMFNYTFSGIVRHGEGWDAYMYNMTSQKWLHPDNSSRHIWWHHVAIIIPHDVIKTMNSSLLYITEGKNTDPYPGVEDVGLLVMAAAAIQARSTAAVLWQVPNQPIEFPIDPEHRERIEDDAIALTWWYYMTFPNPDPYWVLELPMTKAAVKALDMMQQVIPKYTGHPITDFYVAGASKRGWTTWLVGAVDKRVKAIMPIVLCALDVRKFAHRQFTYYGAWSFALRPYYDMNFTKLLDTPATRKMMTFIDPWFYRQRLTMPKLAINAVGDEFQMPDDQRHWAHDMPGEMNLLMVKNAEHMMVTGIFELMQGMFSFVQALQSGCQRPNYTWFINETTGDITVHTNVKPTVVSVAYSFSGEGVSKGKRDFRWAAINATPCPFKVLGACLRPLIWETVYNATMIDDYTYTAHFDVPATGWLGFMIELQFANPCGMDDFYFTSPVSVIPNTAPFPDCHGTACRSHLV